ncbi:MAG: hypothetical protein AAGG56_12080 [Pseudomonadota bacterium]
MTRLQDYALAALALIVSVAALGFFASIGLVVLGAAVVAGLIISAAAWIGTLVAPKSEIADV